jgi:hypothetical protein
MTRRDAVRVNLFERGVLSGSDRSLRCAIVDLSASGALLTVTSRLPQPPLTLRFELGEETLELPVELLRVLHGRGVAVSFSPPYSERLYRAIASEQRRAIASGRIGISDRRTPGTRKGPAGG